MNYKTAGNISMSTSLVNISLGNYQGDISSNLDPKAALLSSRIDKEESSFLPFYSRFHSVTRDINRCQTHWPNIFNVAGEGQRHRDGHSKVEDKERRRWGTPIKIESALSKNFLKGFRIATL